ncbi:hypothetical protein D3C71_2017060 [compost metagenome]
MRLAERSAKCLMRETFRQATMALLLAVEPSLAALQDKRKLRHPSRAACITSRCLKQIPPITMRLESGLQATLRVKSAVFRDAP